MNVYVLIILILIICMMIDDTGFILFLICLVFILLFSWWLKNIDKPMQSENFVYYPQDPVVDNDEDFIAKINHEPPKPLETICMKETPKDLR